ncbi:MAG TPA: 50S ribosomal protein L11 methyltransferase, partial [Nitrospiria bacterium]
CLAEYLLNIEGETVIDLGCGSGFLAILAAKLGAKQVYALDYLADACELTLKNADLNGVADVMICKQGDLFESMEGIRAETIINDVSGVAEDLARASGWFPEPIPTGGPDGADLAVRMFDAAPAHLSPNGRVIFPLISLSNEERILDAARANFKEINRLHHRRFPLPPSLSKNAAVMDKILANKNFRVFKKGSRWVWELQVFEARHPRRSYLSE